MQSTKQSVLKSGNLNPMYRQKAILRNQNENIQFPKRKIQ